MIERLPLDGSRYAFGIGPMRSGSTSLYHYLRQHPDICMAREKETDYFSLGELEIKDLPRGVTGHRKADFAAYRATFSHWRNERVAAEVSPSYLFFPRAAERLLAVAPKGRFIACLRDPVDRAYSHFSFTRKNDTEPEHDFRRALALEPDRTEWGIRYAYLEASRYAGQLSGFLDRFPREQIHVMVFEDFVKDPAAAMRNVFEFLEVDPEVRLDTSIAFNRSGVLPASLRRFYRPTRVRRALARTLPPRLVSAIGRRLMSGLPGIDLELRAELVDGFRDGIFELQNRLALDLSHWLAVDRRVSPNQE